jgi:hypothetical protein
MAFRRIRFPLKGQASHQTCPGCGVDLQDDDHGGSPFCHDCREKHETVVKMDLVAADLMMVPVTQAPTRSR